MLSKIVAAGLCIAFQIATATHLQKPLDVRRGALHSGFYEIHNKAFDGQLVGFYQHEPIVVLNNATVPKVATLGKWRVKEVMPALYSISNVGLGVRLFRNADNFITAGKSDILFTIEDAGNETFVIGLDPEQLGEGEDKHFWTQYSFCETEVHLDPAFDGEEQLLQQWEFKPWAQ